MDDRRSVLRDLPMLQLLPADVREFLVDSFDPISFSFGGAIVREGDPADALYVLVSGRARVVKRAENGEDVPLGMLRAGDSFGEMALLAHTTRTATVRASSDCEALKLDRGVFEALQRTNPEIRRYLELQVKHRSLANFFQRYTAFARLPIEALAEMLAELETVSIAAGGLVVREGEDAGPMYVVEEGRLRVFTETNGDRQYLAYLRRGDFFGEMSLFRRMKREASIEAVSPCKLLRLGGETFQELIDKHPDFRARIEERISQYDYRRTAHVPLDFADELLPAELAVHQKVGPRQVDQPVDDPGASSDAGGRAFGSPEGLFGKKAKRIRRFPHVSQIDEMDCGAASLAIVCRHFGRSVNLARIRQLVHTATDGTSLKALCSAATALGLAARAIKASKHDLSEMPLPAIVHWQGNHWLVVYDVDETHVSLSDPALGLRRIRRGEFEEKWTGYAALFDYTREFEKAPEARSSAAWLWPFFRPFSVTMAKAVLLAVVVSALQMVLPVFSQVIVDSVLVEGDTGLLRMLILSMVGVLGFMVVSLVVQRYLLSFAAVRIDAATLDFMTRKLLALPTSYFNTRRTGDIQRRLEGIRQVREFLVQNGVGGLTAAVQLIVAVVVMFVYSPILAAVFLVTAPLYALLMAFSARWLRPIFHDLEEAFGKYHSYQIDSIKGIETVKALGAEGTFRELMLGETHGIARRQFRADFTIMCYQGAIQAVTFLSLVLFLWVGAHQVMNGGLTIGGFVAFSSLVGLANQPIAVLLTLWDNLQHSAVLFNRLNDVLEQEPEQGVDHSQLLPVSALEGRIRFQNVGFRYGGPGSPQILEGLTFEVPPGQTLAIVGRSGSGKTTLIKCLAGLLEPTEGKIFYDGLDLKTLNYRDLRKHTGFVLQENHLFDDTIARNIALGDDQPDMDQVLWAARAGNAHEFIERFPLGYDTRVGETGIALSGGQRQRIAIARALYHRPSVIVFDEATSSLDTESETAVKENLDLLLENRTAVVIAHRLSTIRDADSIIVIDRGKIVERGTHDELMTRQGLYYYLCGQQLVM